MIRPRLTTSELESIGRPSGAREGVFVMLKAYFDDAGTHQGSKVVVMGGLIGTVAQWQKFDAAWAAKLAAPLPGKPPLKAFHLSPCVACDQEFLGYTRPESDALIHDMRQIIVECELISTASAIDVEAWDELVQGDIRERWGEPLNACFVNCIDEAIRVAKAHTDGRKLAIFFDRGIENQALRDIADEFTKPLADPWITSITFSKVACVLPLQGADMTATESRWYAEEWLENGDRAESRIHFRRYLEKIRAQGLMFGREEILASLQQENSDLAPL